MCNDSIELFADTSNPFEHSKLHVTLTEVKRHVHGSTHIQVHS